MASSSAQWSWLLFLRIALFFVEALQPRPHVFRKLAEVKQP